jgi:hypothetical protein
MHTPRKDVKMPAIAKREGFNLKMNDDTNIDQIAVVLTRTVAFRIVVSSAAETKRMK